MNGICLHFGSFLVQKLSRNTIPKKVCSSLYTMLWGICLRLKVGDGESRRRQGEGYRRNLDQNQVLNWFCYIHILLAIRPSVRASIHRSYKRIDEILTRTKYWINCVIFISLHPSIHSTVRLTIICSLRNHGHTNWNKKLEFRVYYILP